jgi:hypothetical protein
MATNSTACDPKRLALSARRFEEAKGRDALTAFLRATAGVSNIEDVPPDDGFRVNRALRDEVISGSPREKMMASIRSKAFAKMGRRR